TAANAAASSLAIGHLREFGPEVVILVLGDLFEVGDRTAEAGGEGAEDPGMGVEAVGFVQGADRGALLGGRPDGGGVVGDGDDVVVAVGAPHVVAEGVYGPVAADAPVAGHGVAAVSWAGQCSYT